MRLAPEPRAQARWLWIGGLVLLAAGLAALRWWPAILPVLLPGWGRCPFLSLTGHPCPTCEGTHAALHLARGELPAALAANPLVALVLVGLVAGGLVALAATAVPAWRRQLVLSRREQRGLLWLGVLAILANWFYLLARSR